jgi:hypothetical protein
MGNNIEERIFYMGKGRCILSSLNKLKENMDAHDRPRGLFQTTTT